jgi:glycerophosphoryl diester phosphodiesterase
VNPVAYAHRGFSLIGAENSMSAFEAAVALGYTHLETDARVSADGVAVAFHDRVLDRVTNDQGTLSKLPWARIAQARILGTEPIPRLEEVLDAFNNCHVNIDVKSHAAIGPTLDALRRTRSWSRVRLAAFNDRRLATLRAAAGPSVATALSPSEVLALKAASVSRRRIGSPRHLPKGDLAVQVPDRLRRLALVDRALVEAAHRRNLPVHVWTVNRRSDMIRLLDLGVDAIMTDRADLLRAVLQERGEWNR